MNEGRRKRLSTLLGQIEGIRAAVEEVRDDEQADFNDKSETWQQGEKGEAAQAVIESLDAAVESLNTTFENVENASADS